MKSDNENEMVGNSNELAGKCNGRSTSLRRINPANQHPWSGKLTTFAVGLGVGALVGLLFAPASGKNTRNYLARTAKQGLDDAASTGKQWTRRAQDTVGDVKANVASVVEAGQKAYRTARDA